MTLATPEGWKSHPGTVGQAILGTPHICDEAGEPLPMGKSISKVKLNLIITMITRKPKVFIINMAGDLSAMSAIWTKIIFYI